MSHQTLLPFVLQGTATATSPPSEIGVSEVRKRRVAGSQMGASYAVPIVGLPNDELQQVKKDLTMVPQDSAFGGPPTPSFDAFATDETHIHVPRFYGYHRWGSPDTCELSDGHPMQCAFVGTLNQTQQEATAQTLMQLSAEPNGGLLVLPCGYGKTVCALYIAHKLGRRTLVLVHKGFLVQQWHERVASFLPEATCGKIQQNVVDADADIVVGMVQSISKREYPEHIMSSFGTVIIDEAHHMSAPVFSRALRCLPAKYICGLSATPERKDGMTRLLYYSMGDIAHRIERNPEHTLVSCILYEGGMRTEIKYRDGRVSMPLMLNALVKDATRNECIATHIVRYLEHDRYVIVLTDRIEQLKALLQLLIDKGVGAHDIAFYIGSTPASERTRASERRCILSTYSMAKEGLDIPRLDTLVMATPKGDIVQASGRVQRKHPEKKTPLIVDFVDTFSVFEALRWKRWRFYRQEKFVCQSFNSVSRDVSWFV